MRLTKKLATAETQPDVQASENFHQKLAGKLRAAKPDSMGEILAAYLRGILLNWRVAVPAFAALVVIGLTVAIWRQPSNAPSPTMAGIRTAPVSDADDDLSPTIANYQRVASQSLDKLDALLTRQGNRPLPSMPIYTASTLGLAQESF